jgi:hypothetical protein
MTISDAVSRGFIRFKEPVRLLPNLFRAIPMAEAAIVLIQADPSTSAPIRADPSTSGVDS